MPRSCSLPSSGAPCIPTGASRSASSEFADPLLHPAIDRAARTSRRVLVLPLILNAAGHVRHDIPEAIQWAQKRHPQVEFRYAPHLGVSDPLLRILKRLLRQAMLTLDVPDPHTTGLVLLGPGLQRTGWTKW